MSPAESVSLAAETLAQVRRYRPNSGLTERLRDINQAQLHRYIVTGGNPLEPS